MKNIGNIIKTLQNIMRKDQGVSGDAQRIEQLGWMITLKIIDDKDCYSGDAPSSVDIKGWVRWRKDGKFILKVAHTC